MTSENIYPARLIVNVQYDNKYEDIFNVTVSPRGDMYMNFGKVFHCIHGSHHESGQAHLKINDKILYKVEDEPPAKILQPRYAMEGLILGKQLLINYFRNVLPLIKPALDQRFIVNLDKCEYGITFDTFFWNHSDPEKWRVEHLREFYPGGMFNSIILYRFVLGMTPGFVVVARSAEKEDEWTCALTKSFLDRPVSTNSTEWVSVGRHIIWNPQKK